MIRRKSSGFTLVEMMVAVFISTIVLTAIYGVWIRVHRQIGRSHAKQTLQNELRAIANHMEKDFKAIKEGTYEAPPGEQSPDGTKLKITFERFTETEEGKIAQDSTEEVEYHLRNGLLTRTTDTSRKILSVNLDSIIVTKAVDEASLEATDLESTDEDFKAAREAKLDIAISGKKRIPGSINEVYQIERTSLVMRDEYYKKTNKTFVSNFDLAEMDTDEVMVSDSSEDINFGDPDQEFNAEQLSALDRDQLEGMKATQQDLLSMASDAFDNVNDNINDIDTGSNFWDTLNILSDSEGEKVKKMKKALKNAETVEAVDDAVKDLEEYAQAKEVEFHKSSIPGYESMSEEQKQIHEKAYEIAVQDRAIKYANKKAKEEDPDADESPMMIDLMTQVQDMTYEDEEGEQTVSATQNEEAQQEAQALKDAYEDINLDWMGEFGEEPEEVVAYNAAKSLVNQGRSKKDTIEMRDRAENNISEIDKAMEGK
jgi:prepilin-type N-terminal cleavage/methylation domain-containing protein